jgi:hypothetical protein
MKQLTIFASMLVFLAALEPLHAQDLDKEAVKKLVDSKTFVFHAQSATPMGGGTRQLTSDYNMKLTGDSLVTYLPYFGRAYTATLPGEGGLDFISSDFTYKVKEKKKGGWEVTIEPKDQRNVRSMLLSLSESGYASLNVTSNNRQPISFYGYVSSKN